MAFYAQLFPVVNALCPFLLPTQAANLALLIGALLVKRTLCLTRLAQTLPVPPVRQREAPQHELLHRLKRLSRFLSNAQVDPVAVQVAFIPAVLARLGHPRRLGLILDWTSFDTLLPALAVARTGARTGRRLTKAERQRKYQVLTIAVPRCGRALPLLSVVYERDKLPADSSQNRLEEQALAHVLDALPASVRPVVLADRGFGRVAFVQWLQQRGVDYVLRIKRRVKITRTDGTSWLVGQEGLKRGQVRWCPDVRLGTYHDRPRDLVVNLVCAWRSPKRPRPGGAKRRSRAYQQPWYLVTSLTALDQAVAWYRQRFWIEATFKDFQSTFGLDEVQVGSAARLGRLVAALTLAVAWLHLLALPNVGRLPRGWAASVVTCGRASLVSLALAYLDQRGRFPPGALPAARAPARLPSLAKAA